MTELDPRLLRQIKDAERKIQAILCDLVNDHPLEIDQVRVDTRNFPGIERLKPALREIGRVDPELGSWKQARQPTPLRIPAVGHRATT